MERFHEEFEGVFILCFWGGYVQNKPQEPQILLLCVLLQSRIMFVPISSDFKMISKVSSVFVLYPPITFMPILWQIKCDFSVLLTYNLWKETWPTVKSNSSFVLFWSFCNINFFLLQKKNTNCKFIPVILPLQLFGEFQVKPSDEWIKMAIVLLDFTKLYCIKKSDK